MVTNKDIKIDDLITIYDKLDEYINNLDSKNSQHRQLVIKAIEEYIKRYVTPALYLLPNIDLNKVLGKSITGLGLNFLFDSNRENLNRPSDEEMDDVLIGLAKLEPTPELRQRFWDAWLVDQSMLCIIGLCNFLDEPLTPTRNKSIKPDVLNEEIQQLQHILTLPITPAFEQWIEGVLKGEKEALAQWSEEITVS